MQACFDGLQATCQASGSSCGCSARQQSTARLCMTGRYDQKDGLVHVATFSSSLVLAANPGTSLTPAVLTGALWWTEPLDSWPGCHSHVSSMRGGGRHWCLLLWQIIWQNPADQNQPQEDSRGCCRWSYMQYSHSCGILASFGMASQLRCLYQSWDVSLLCKPFWGLD